MFIFHWHRLGTGWPDGGSVALCCRQGGDKVKDEDTSPYRLPLSFHDRFTQYLLLCFTQMHIFKAVFWDVTHSLLLLFKPAFSSEWTSALSKGCFEDYSVCKLMPVIIITNGVIFKLLLSCFLFNDLLCIMYHQSVHLSRSSVLLTLVHLWHVLYSRWFLFFFLPLMITGKGSMVEQRCMEGRGMRYEVWHCAVHASVTDVHVESMSGVYMHQWPAQPGACMFPVWCNPEVIPSCMTGVIVQDESSLYSLTCTASHIY